MNDAEAPDPQPQRRRLNPIPAGVRRRYHDAIAPVAEALARTHGAPHLFTTLGFIFTAVGAVFMAMSHLRWAGVFILLGGVCGTLDVYLARRGVSVSKFGALYDSTLERFSELLMFFGMAWHFGTTDQFIAWVGTLIAMGGSIMVSYVKARAEALGLEAEGGIMLRPERIAYIGFGALFGRVWLIGELPLILAIWSVAVLANVTAVQRILHVYQLGHAHANVPKSVASESLELPTEKQ